MEIEAVKFVNKMYPRTDAHWILLLYARVLCQPDSPGLD